MKRLSIILLAFAVSVAAAVGWSFVRWRDEAVRVGTSLYTTRTMFERLENRTRKLPRAPLIVWLGDSTIMKAETDFLPYPGQIDARLRRSGLSYETLILAEAGIGPFVQYFVVGQVLRFKPTQLFLVANLQALTRSGRERGVLESASFLPPGELWRAFALPWHAAGISIPRLLLARSLAWQPVETVIYFLEGLRQLFRDEIYSSRRPLTFWDRGRTSARGMRRLMAPIDEHSPPVAMLAATVELAVRHGIPTTVILSPVRPLAHTLDGANSGPRLPERIKAVGRAVTAAGGRFVDLHAALGAEMFRDFGGHFTASGTTRMARALEPHVWQAVMIARASEPR